MHKRNNILYTVAVLVLIVGLLVPMLAACGDDDDDATTTVPVTTTVKPTTPPATTAASTEPIKIGIIWPYSGAQGGYGPVVMDPSVKVYQHMVENRGGVLGRPVKFIVEDNQSTTSGSAAAAVKLLEVDKVSMIFCGGVSEPHIATVALECQKKGVPLLSFTTGASGSERNPYRFAVAMPPYSIIMDKVVDFVTNKLKPTTVGFLSVATPEYAERVDYMKKAFNTSGIKDVISESIGFEVTDLSPFVTKIRYANPDVLIIASSVGTQPVTLLKQAAGLGGFGNMKIVATDQAAIGSGAVVVPEAVGLYMWSPWIEGEGTPFGAEYARLANGPDGFTIPGMSVAGEAEIQIFGAAIAAIEAAGTDNPAEVLKVLRSGTLRWQSAMEEITLGSNGLVNGSGLITQVQMVQGKQTLVRAD